MNKQWIAWILIAGMLVFSAAVYERLPETVPMRWSFSGEVMSEQPRAVAALALPAFAAAVVIVRRLLRRVDPRAENYERFEKTYWRYLNLTAGAIGVFHVLLLGGAIGWQLAIPQIVMLIGGMVLLLVANEARRVQPNWFIGIRTPWTLSDPDVWRATHALAGRLLFGCALLVLLMSLLLPTATGLVITVVLLVGASAFLVYYSYRDYQQRRAQA